MKLIKHSSAFSYRFMQNTALGSKCEVKVKPTNENSGKTKLITTFIGALRYGTTSLIRTSFLSEQVTTGITNF